MTDLERDAYQRGGEGNEMLKRLFEKRPRELGLSARLIKEKNPSSVICDSCGHRDMSHYGNPAREIAGCISLIGRFGSSGCACHGWKKEQPHA